MAIAGRRSAAITTGDLEGRDDIQMKIRVIQSRGQGQAVIVPTIGAADRDQGWVWVDIEADQEDRDELLAVASELGLDALAVRDAVSDRDIPKVDDLGSQLLIVLHGLRDDRIETYVVTCFVADDYLVSVRREHSPAVDALWNQLLERPDIITGGPDLTMALLADVLSRRLVAVLDAFDARVDDLVIRALAADASLVGDLTAVRTDLARVRHVVHPQREALDLLRSSTSILITEPGRRRFSDAFDVASRAATGLDAARTALAETLDAYRGAEARKATEVTKVLTVYAAIMFPLSLIASFFGMNFDNLPGLESDWGWIIVTAVMFAIATVSLGVFVTVGWIHRPSGRQAGSTLGRGLVEAARAPAQVVGAVFEISTMPIRTVATSRRPDPKIEDRG